MTSLSSANENSMNYASLAFAKSTKILVGEGFKLSTHKKYDSLSGSDWSFLFLGSAPDLNDIIVISK